MNRITVFNQKGGVGKTTTTLNLGAALALAGRPPLLIDLDPQAHLSSILGVQVDSGSKSIFAFYTEARPLAELKLEVAGHAHLVPSHGELTKVDSLFGKGPNILNHLNQGITDEIEADHARPVLIDCCPLVGVLSLNAIFAADKILIPVSADFLALKGAHAVTKTLKALEHVLKRRIERRYLVTRYDGRRKMSGEVVRQLEEAFSGEVCRTKIAENVSLAESPAYNMDVFAHAHASRGAKDYKDLLDELIAGGFLQTAEAAAPESAAKTGTSAGTTGIA
jgi:chromosome partitioning protein